MTLADDGFLRRALELAEKGRGLVEPNPLVGAVVVRDGEIVGEGWHPFYGGPHAEVVALDHAGEAARGATLYVTLEPCCHHGKTPPCTDRVLASGVRRVVAAMLDPFPEVSGKGFAQLKAAGIDVESGLMVAEARRLNRPYLKRLATGRPYLHAKWAMTLDGKIASRTGSSRWISNESSRAHAHSFRGTVDAILVGAGTVEHDDPLLTPRPSGPRIPVRVVLDSRARIGLSTQLVRTAGTIPTLIVTTACADRDKLEALRAAGCDVLVAPSDPKGRPDIAWLLDELGRRRMTNVLAEGGSGLLGSLVDSRLIDAVRVYVAPRVIGGRDALPAVGGLGIESMAHALSLAEVSWTELDGDLFLSAVVEGTETQEPS